MTRWSGRDFRDRETLAEVPFTSRSAVQSALASLTVESPFEIVAQDGHLPSYENLADPENFMIVRERVTKRLVGTIGAGQLRRWRRADANVSFDGRRLVICTEGTEPLKIYDVESRRELLSLGHGLAGLGNVQFSPDGNAIGARAADGVLHIWTAPSWAEIAATQKPARTVAP